MNQPTSFLDPNFPTHVCKLNCTIYGLKQSPRAWFQRLHDFLVFIGFFNSKSDSSLFIRHGNNLILAILVYVDDIIFIGSASFDVSNVLDQICATFDSHRLGPLNFFSSGQSYSHSGGSSA